MPSKLDFYAQMADHTAKQVTGSFGEWTAFLETAGRLYKYPFHEQLMIYAQRPDATACEEYDYLILFAYSSVHAGAKPARSAVLWEAMCDMAVP